MTEHQPRIARRGALGLAAAAGPLTALATSGPAAAARPRRGGTMAWLGTSGWKLEADGHVLLVDPYVSRYPTGLAAGAFDPNTPLSVDADAIRAAIPETASTVLVTHSHWDHLNDVPHLALRDTARVIGTMTTRYVAGALGVPSAQLAPVKGGEVFDLGEFVVRVVSSLHSRNTAYSILFPGVLTGQPSVPTRISDLPEGDTLSFVVSRPRGPRIYLMGASDFDDQSLAGLAPDVAAVAVPSSSATHDYVPRLMEALDQPRVVIPVHWDNFETPLQNPPQADAASRQRLDDLVRQVRRVSPGTQVVVPSYLDELRLL